MEYQYSRQLNRPIRYFKFFTMPEIFCVAVATVVVPQIFGFQALLLGLLGFLLYLLVFRIGKPPGYTVHCIKSFLRPEHFSAGRGCYPKKVIRIASANESH